MKLLVVLLALNSFSNPPTRLVVVDKNLENPISYTDDFTTDLYFKRNFPIYLSDLDAVISTSEKVAKMLDQKTGCHISDTLYANHTIFIVHANCDERKALTIRLMTAVKEKNTSFDFELVNQDDTRRKAQRKLFDLAAYLTR